VSSRISDIQLGTWGLHGRLDTFWQVSKSSTISSKTLFQWPTLFLNLVIEELKLAAASWVADCTTFPAVALDGTPGAVVVAAVEVIVLVTFATVTTWPWPWSVAALGAAFGAEPGGGASVPFPIEAGAAFEGTLEEGAFAPLPLSAEVALGASVWGVGRGWERRVVITLKEKKQDNLVGSLQRRKKGESVTKAYLTAHGTPSELLDKLQNSMRPWLASGLGALADSTDLAAA
jgi:hypothetical protein